MWLRLAALQGYRKAGENVKILTKKMTSEQLHDANQMVQDWKPKT